MSSRRLTYPTATVLVAIASGHRYGFDLMDATGLPDGTVYPILRRLERRGLLEGDWEEAAIARADGRPPRRYYRPTPEGQELIATAIERYPTLLRLFPDEGAIQSLD